MGQPIVVATAPAEPSTGDQATALIAGATAVVATQAAEAASEAQATAEDAAARVDTAREVAFDAAAAVARLEDELGDVREQMMELAMDVVEALGDDADPGAPADDLTPEKTTDAPATTAEPKDDKPKTPKSWFGGRRSGGSVSPWFKGR